FGSSRAPEEMPSVMIGAARALGRRAIVSRGWAGLSGFEDGPDCLAIGETNLQTLFARVAAVVHHGGAGTTTLAARAGAPQVVVPQLYDRHYFAARVEELGIGTAHVSGTPTLDSLTRALQTALRPEVADRAERMSARVRRDGARVAAERLMTLAREG